MQTIDRSGNLAPNDTRSIEIGREPSAAYMQTIDRSGNLAPNYTLANALVRSTTLMGFFLVDTNVANQGLWNVATLAVATSLVLYFREALHMGNAEAANNVTNWFGTTWLLTLLGGFLGDSYLGRFWTCVLFQLIHVLVCNSSAHTRIALVI
jgi:hypothetical protein